MLAVYSSPMQYCLVIRFWALDVMHHATRKVACESRQCSDTSDTSAPLCIMQSTALACVLQMTKKLVRRTLFLEQSCPDSKL